MICGGAGAQRPQSARVCSLVTGRLAEVAFGVQRLYQVAASTCAKFGPPRRPMTARPLPVHRKDDPRSRTKPDISRLVGHSEKH
jgi:hypothetical protein